MTDLTTVKISSRYQISIPTQARKQLAIEAGDQLLVDVQDGVLVLVPQPDDYVAHMAGLHQEVWGNMDTAVYLNEERNAWTPSPADSPSTT